jgi:soluble cytochrome b562
MALDNILKPKSQDEIQDLEKRGFRKNAGKWRFNINISPLISAYEKDEDIEKIRKGLIELLSVKIDDIGLFADDAEVKKFKDIIEKFKKIDENSNVDEIDKVMEILYDWADDNDVWVESF